MKQGLVFLKSVWGCTCAVTALPVSQLQMACYSTKYFMTCVIVFPQNANAVKEQGSPAPRVWDFFLQCVQWQWFWFKMKKGFVLEGETIYPRKAQVVQCVECHRQCPIQLSSPSMWWWRSCLLALNESGTIMRFPEAWLEPIALSRHFQRYFKGNLDTYICHELLCRLEAERYNFKVQYLK